MVGVTFYQYLHVVSLVVIFAQGEVPKWNDVNFQGTILQMWLTRDEQSMAPLLCAEGDAWMNLLSKTGPPRNDEGDLLGSKANAWCATKKRTARACAVAHAGGRSRDRVAGCRLWVASEGVVAASHDKGQGQEKLSDRHLREVQGSVHNEGENPQPEVSEQGEHDRILVVDMALVLHCPEPQDEVDGPAPLEKKAQGNLDGPWWSRHACVQLKGCTYMIAEGMTKYLTDRAAQNRDRR